MLKRKIDKKGQHFTVGQVITVIILLLLIVLLVPYFIKTAPKILGQWLPFFNVLNATENDPARNMLDPRLRDNSYEFILLSVGENFEVESIELRPNLFHFNRISKDLRHGCSSKDFPSYRTKGCWVFAAKKEILYTGLFGNSDDFASDKCANFLYSPSASEIDTPFFEPISGDLSYFKNNCYAPESYKCDEGACEFIRRFFTLSCLKTILSTNQGIGEYFFDNHALICAAPLPGRNLLVECVPEADGAKLDHNLAFGAIEVYECSCSGKSCAWKFIKKVS